MPGLRFITFALTLSAIVLTNRAAGKDPARVPVLLELFTSEGCSSCPRADRLLEVLDQTQPVAGADLIVLSEHVDYWDRLGWMDPFSSSQYTARQQEYANHFKLDGVYTPQLVVDGQFGFVGRDESEAVSAIQKAIRKPKLPVAISILSRGGNQVTARIELAASGPTAKGSRGILYIALARNRTESLVPRGENAGRSLAHVAVVRMLKQLGAIDLGRAITREVVLTVEPGGGINGSRVIAFLQDPRSGHVLGVAAHRL